MPSASAYLLFALGLRRLLGKDGTTVGEPRGIADLGRHYRQGIVVNVLNPKTVLFFLAFLPQFIDPDAPVAPQSGSRRSS